jgi:hypothetical protein
MAGPAPRGTVGGRAQAERVSVAFALPARAALYGDGTVAGMRAND